MKKQLEEVIIKNSHLEKTIEELKKQQTLEKKEDSPRPEEPKETKTEKKEDSTKTEEPKTETTEDVQ